MKSKDGFVQAYNAQAAVDADHQIIVNHDVVQTPSDNGVTAQNKVDLIQFSERRNGPCKAYESEIYSEQLSAARVGSEQLS